MSDKEKEIEKRVLKAKQDSIRTIGDVLKDAHSNDGSLDDAASEVESRLMDILGKTSKPRPSVDVSTVVVKTFGDWIGRIRECERAETTLSDLISEIQDEQRFLQ